MKYAVKIGDVCPMCRIKILLPKTETHELKWKEHRATFTLESAWCSHCNDGFFIQADKVKEMEDTVISWYREEEQKKEPDTLISPDIHVDLTQPDFSKEAFDKTIDSILNAPWPPQQHFFITEKAWAGCMVDEQVQHNRGNDPYRTRIKR